MVDLLDIYHPKFHTVKTENNLTSGKKESVESIIFYIDYVFDIEKAKKAIESVQRSPKRYCGRKEKTRNKVCCAE